MAQRATSLGPKPSLLVVFFGLFFVGFSILSFVLAFVFFGRVSGSGEVTRRATSLGHKPSLFVFIWFRFEFVYFRMSPKNLVFPLKKFRLFLICFLFNFPFQSPFLFPSFFLLCLLSFFLSFLLSLFLFPSLCLSFDGLLLCLLCCLVFFHCFFICLYFFPLLVVFLSLFLLRCCLLGLAFLVCLNNANLT